jgi:hypothetical protein
MNKCAVFAVGIMLLSASPALSSGHIDRPHDWTVEIETQELSRQFDYHNSHYTQVAKTTIDYYHQTDTDHKTNYEYMWFHGPRAIGLERLHKFQLDQGDGVAINIKHKTPTPDNAEMSAAADALAHVILDAYINKNPVTIVNVPEASYATIVSELESVHHFVAQADVGPDHPIDSGINIFVESESGTNQTLCYF